MNLKADRSFQRSGATIKVLEDAMHRISQSHKSQGRITRGQDVLFRRKNCSQCTAAEHRFSLLVVVRHADMRAAGIIARIALLDFVAGRPFFGGALVKRQSQTAVTWPGCVAAGSDRYDCSNGGFCELYNTAWECFAGDSTRVNTDGSSIAASPVTKQGCTAHLDHYDCADGGFCEQENGQWVCFDASMNR